MPPERHIAAQAHCAPTIELTQEALNWRRFVPPARINTVKEPQT
jgi:hypothetical protein